MKIALTGVKSAFTEDLLGRLRESLEGETLMLWEPDTAAPDEDLEVLLWMSAVTPEALRGLKKLQMIQTVSDGYESVDVETATEMGVWVSYAPGEQTGNADSVAEYAVMLLIAAMRRVGVAQRWIGDRSITKPMVNRALDGSKICIVGLGGIGSKVAERLKPFGVELSAVDEHPERAPKDVPTRPADELIAAVGDVDGVIVCVRASKKNANLIDGKVLAGMKKGAVLVNIARGTLVDEGALCEAVKSGQIGGAGLDVLRQEPPEPSNPLFALPQIFITPHLAGFTGLMVEGTVKYVSEVIGKLKEGKRVGSLLNEPKSPRKQLSE